MYQKERNEANFFQFLTVKKNMIHTLVVETKATDLRVIV